MANFWIFVWNVRVLVACAKIILSAWIQSRIQQLRPNDFEGEWAIDDFLYELHGEIESTKQGKKKSRIYFPGRQRATNVELWDLEMLCYILRNFCQLDRTMESDLDNLRNLRDILASKRLDGYHNDGVDIVQQTRLRNVLAKIAGYINDEDLRRSVDRRVGNVMTEMDEKIANKNDEGYQEQRRLLQEWYEQDQEAVGLLIDIKKDSAETLHLMREMQGLLKHELTIPDTNITININGYTPAKEEEISNFLLRLIDEESGRNLSDRSPEDQYYDLRVAIRKAIQRFFNSRVIDVSRPVTYRIVHTRTKCIQLTIRCSTFDSFLQLLTDGLEDKLTHLFKPVEVELRKLPGMEDVELDVEIKEEDFIANIIAVVEQLYKRKITRSEVVPHKQGLSWHLGVASPTMESAEQLNKSLQDGSLQKRLQQLTELIRQELGTPELNLEITDYRPGNVYTVKSSNVTYSDVGIYSSDFPSFPGHDMYNPVSPYRVGRDTDAVGDNIVNDLTEIGTLVNRESSAQGLQYFTRQLLQWMWNNVQNTIPMQLSRSYKRLKFDSEIELDDKKLNITDTAMINEVDVACVDNANSRVLLVNLKLDKVTSSIATSSKPWGVCKISEHGIAVTLPGEKKIQMFSVGDAVLIEDGTIPVAGCCRGIACWKNALFVSYIGSHGSIQMINLRGEVMKTFMKSVGNVHLKAPAYLAHTPFSNTLYAADVVTKMITANCLDTDECKRFNVGHMIDSISGLTIDEDEKLYVTDWVSDRLYLVDMAAKTIRLSLSAEDGLVCPQGVSYYKGDKKTRVIMSMENKLHILNETALGSFPSVSSISSCGEQYLQDKSDNQSSNYWPDLQLNTLDLAY